MSPAHPEPKRQAPQPFSPQQPGRPQPARPQPAQPHAAPAVSSRDGVEPSEGGMALIMTLIFTILLYAIVSDLVVTARTARLTGENDALQTRMRSHMGYCLGEVEAMLLEDLAAAAAAEGGEGGGGAGGLGGLPGLGGAGAGAGGEGGEEEESDPASESDGSQDGWYEPNAYTDGDITTYVWVEDENAKFNLLTLVSPDEDFAAESRKRFVRLIDALRDDTDFDLSRGDGESMADVVTDWLRSRNRTEFLPRPKLKSDQEDEQREVSVPLHLDELLLLRNIDRELFYDKVLDGELIPGLESVVTLFTSWSFDRGDPNDPNFRQAEGEGEGGEGAGNAPEPIAGPGDPPPQPEGEGVRININTATRPVLRALFPPEEISDLVLDAILRYRNEPAEEEEGGFGEDSATDDFLGVVDGGEETKRKVFTSMDQLDEIEEYMNLPDPTVKDRMRQLCGVRSDVFSIHMASLFVRNEERRVFAMRRARSVQVRIDDGEEGLLYPLIPLEQRIGLRVKGRDFYEDSGLDQFSVNDEMDRFSQEEKAWNPFLLEFYLPQDERDRIFSYR